MFDVVPSRWWFYTLSLLLFQLALFAKSAVSFVPVSLLLVTWWRRERLRWRDAGPLLPMLVQAWAMGRMTSYVEQLTGAAGHQFHMGFLERVLVSGRSFWFYLGKLFYPHQLTFIYERWHVDSHVWWQYLYPVATVVTLAGLWRCRRRIGKGLFTAFMHFYVCTSLLILFLVLFMTRYTFVSDHWQYFGCMSIMAMVAAGITVAPGRLERGIPFLKPMLCGTLLFVLGVLSWRQCGMYTDMETLWRITLVRNPRCFLAHNNLGNLLLQKGQMDEAMAHYQTAAEIQPDFTDAQFNLANVLYEKGRVDEAIVHYQKALESQPGFAEIHNNLGNALLRKGQVDEAMAHYQKALEDQPGFAEVHNNLGNVLLQKGQVEEATAHFLKALEIQPDYADAYYNLGNVYFQKRQMDEAVTCFQKALKIQPDCAKIHNNLGNALLLKGQALDAIAHYRLSLKLQPDNPDVLSNLAWVLATWPETPVRDGAQAIELAQRANQLSGDLEPAILRTLAAAYAEGGRFAEAVTTARQAWQLATNRNNIALADALQSQLKLYQAGAPFRDPGLTNSAGNAGNP